MFTHGRVETNKGGRTRDMLYELGAWHVVAPAQKVIIHARQPKLLSMTEATLSKTSQPHRLFAAAAVATQIRVRVAVRPSVQQAARLGFLDARDATRLPFPLAEYFTLQVIAVTLQSATIEPYRCGVGREREK